MLVHLRVTCPADRTSAVLDLFDASPGTANVAVAAGASRRPVGDLVLADVARESADDLVTGLRELGVDHDGTITMDSVGTAVSHAAEHAERAAPGDASDTVIWSAVVRGAWENAELTWNFVLFMALATVLAAMAVVQDSSILVIGAMVVGPEFGPLSAVAVGLVHGTPRLSRRALATVAAGFAAAIALVALASLAGRGAGWVTLHDLTGPRPRTGFIWSPDRWSFAVAFVAGIAGVLSLTSAKSSVLVGVFISVTTVPAAGNLALALAFLDGDELRGSAEQLGVNAGAIVLAGTVTLLIQKLLWRRRVRPRRLHEALAQHHRRLM